MKSMIIQGKTWHQRLSPAKHSFTYPLYLYSLDLAELPELSKSISGFGYNRRAIVSIWDRDYIDHSNLPIREKLLGFIKDQGYTLNIGKIQLVTAARYFGYVFNPVSFYYCYSPTGELLCNVAEINNTYGERHLYLVPAPALSGQTIQEPDLASKYSNVFQCNKEFFVSPFYQIEGDYQFFFSDISKSLDVRINIEKAGEVTFRSQVCGELSELSSTNLATTILRYPLSALLTIPRIYWQAQILRFRRRLPMIKKPEPISPRTSSNKKPGLFERIAIKIVDSEFAKITDGKLSLQFPDGSVRHYGADSQTRAVMQIHSYRALTRIVRGGSVGLGEGYMDRDWSTPDLSLLLKTFLNNWRMLKQSRLRQSLSHRAINLFAHLLSSNSLSGSPKNIQAHYDLSNDLFKTFLDSSLTYSSAVFPHAGSSLEEAQFEKRRSILERARIKPQSNLLEIGSGWGTLAIEAATTYGCKVKTITLSQQQAELANKRISNSKLNEKVALEITDYRKVTGKFDRIVSVEMLEAVGRNYLGTFFAQCEKLLNPNGLVVLQVITMPECEYQSYNSRRDWIQKYIFPGSHLPSLQELQSAIAKNSSLVIEEIRNIGPHYARTLVEWRTEFLSRKAEVLALGFDERFIRMWDFYLAASEAKFATRWLNNLQIVLSRPNNRELINEDQQQIGTIKMDEVA